MKNQALFPQKDKSKKIKCRLLQFLFGALRVKLLLNSYWWNNAILPDSRSPGSSLNKASFEYVCCIGFIGIANGWRKGMHIIAFSFLHPF